MVARGNRMEREEENFLFSVVEVTSLKKRERERKRKREREKQEWREVKSL
jgi:hypothetical protein